MPRHWISFRSRNTCVCVCVTKLAELNTLSTPVAAMKLFAATAAKKAATQEEFSKCFLACSSAGVVVPGAYRLLQSLGVPVVPTCCCSAVELAHERLRSLGRLQRLHASFCFLSRPLPKHPIQFEWGRCLNRWLTCSHTGCKHNMKYVSTPFPFIPASFHMFHSCGRSAHPGCVCGYANTSVTRFAIATQFESP